jgi:hypothetical protein
VPDFRNRNSEPDDRLGPIALDLCIRATIHRIKAECEDVVELLDGLTQVERERLLVQLGFGPEDFC